MCLHDCDDDEELMRRVCCHQQPADVVGLRRLELNQGVCHCMRLMLLSESGRYPAMNNKRCTIITKFSDLNSVLLPGFISGALNI